MKIMYNQNKINMFFGGRGGGFPFGGMENPLLTFASRTIITGDKSQVYVVTHEIAHSWTGNDVTCKNWENFWLNEGFTVFEERKVSG